ncbi:phenylalanine--tRNA ligase alpha subunit isoform X2 [Eurytemora carolleeae]|uniref:phenylalanine--tRNA ligase alpha subunit isoform X2 n=1 Tax=Eurytemora carolleeae TaxID=1294199 RepID=UPI000C795292|nr:phenylalanine--tRNA ligase alpha subunit isoform X2 [Eurytemora carolleeae]|eukprot:XP_023335053.1 phenylalanine--tRNA ligase alpha subunit-like isoform X2 [Eurytemora affinis]
MSAEEVLQKLSQESPLTSTQLAQRLNCDHQKIVGSIKSLECLGDVISSKLETIKKWQLTQEGEMVAKDGSHEAIVFYLVPTAGIPQAELMKAAGSVGKVGFSKAMSAGWITLDKTAVPPLVRRKVESVQDTTQVNLAAICSQGGDVVAEKEKVELKKRKLVQEITEKIYILEKGSNFTTSITKAETDLTPEMISSGDWKNISFKPYNFDALGVSPDGGTLHPLLKVRSEYRQIFLEMGFTEMPTNNFVESSFWNFDSLFQPQQHPARDAHDTFFISDPSTTTLTNQEYVEKVSEIHSRGGFGSQGYGYDWKTEEAAKNLLRTHTTAVSARMLHKLAQQDVFTPQKYFSIDRVFRNETLDATHLAEFHQIEGVIVDYGLTLGDLIGVLYQFFQKLGIHQLRFKPAYNPYTEPSMEIFSYHAGLGKWVEIGNSGIFRPEMLLPMGLSKNVLYFYVNVILDLKCCYLWDNLRMCYISMLLLV